MYRINIFALLCPPQPLVCDVSSFATDIWFEINTGPGMTAAMTVLAANRLSSTLVNASPQHGFVQRTFWYLFRLYSSMIGKRYDAVSYISLSAVEYKVPMPIFQQH